MLTTSFGYHNIIYLLSHKNISFFIFTKNKINLYITIYTDQLIITSHIKVMMPTHDVCIYITQDPQDTDIVKQVLHILVLQSKPDCVWMTSKSAPFLQLCTNV